MYGIGVTWRHTCSHVLGIGHRFIVIILSLGFLSNDSCPLNCPAAQRHIPFNYLLKTEDVAQRVAQPTGFRVINVQRTRCAPIALSRRSPIIYVCRAKGEIYYHKFCGLFTRTGLRYSTGASSGCGSNRRVEILGGKRE